MSISGEKFKPSDSINPLKSGIQDFVLLNADYGVCVAKKSDGIIIYTNPALDNMYGYAEGELLGQNFKILLAPTPKKNIDSITSGLVQAVSKNINLEYEILSLKKDGTEFWTTGTTSLANHPTFGETFIAIKTDITARKNREVSLSENESRLSLALSGSGIGMWDWDVEKNTIFYSPVWKGMLGYSDYELPNTLEIWKDRWHPLDRNRLEASIANCISGNSPVFEEKYRLLHKDGSWRWVRTKGDILKSSDGKVRRMVGGNIDITESTRVEEELKGSTERLTLALTAGAVGIWEWDLVNNTLTWDEQMFNLYGTTREKFSGAYDAWRNGLHPDDVARGELELNEALKGNKPFNTEFRVIWSDGSIHDIRALATVRRDENGAPLQIVGTNWDITSQKENEKRAMAATKSKSEFLANMSHEIRTPMNAVISYTKLALETQLDSKQSDYVGKILAASKLLLGIINDVLDYSKIESGHLELESHRFSLEEIFDQMRGLFNFSCEEKKLEFIFDFPSSVPEFFNGDSLRLGQIFTNLLSNAIKFTQRGSVLFRGTCLEEKDEWARIRFEVIDSGIGINHSELTRIFKPFSQADSSTTRKFGGSGLGLVISNKIVEAMGGKLQVESVPGSGTRFFFDLKLDKPPRAALSLLEGKKPALESLKFLIVDDQIAVRELTRNILLSWNARVVESDSGESALEKMLEAELQKDPFDFILLDWKMPGGMDGLELSKKIDEFTKSNIANRSKPSVIVISALNRGSLPEQGQGFDAFLQKPITASKLENVIAPTLYQSQNLGPISSSQRIPDLSGRSILLAEDNPVNQEVGLLWLQKTKARITIANDGQEAVDIFSKGTFDLVLMDLQMPVMDGFAAARAIRKIAPEIPIIALSAAVMEKDRLEALAAGMNDHLKKPIEEEELFRVLEQRIKLRPATVKSVPGPNSIPHLPETLEGFNMTLGLKQCDGNKALYLKLLNRFKAQLDSEFSLLPNSIRSGLKNFPASDIGEKPMSAILHTMRGVAATLGATRIQAEAELIEAAFAKGEMISENQVEVLSESIDTVRRSLAVLVGAQPGS